MFDVTDRALPRRIQLGKGMFFTGLDWRTAFTREQLLDRIADALLRDDGVLGETLSGGVFTAEAVRSDWNRKGRGLPPGFLPVLQWRASVSGAFRRADLRAFAAVLNSGPPEESQRRAVLIPGEGERAIPALCWVGDTALGYLLIELDNARCTGGGLRFGEEEGAVPFEFEAQPEDPESAAPPFRVVFFESGVPEEAAA